MQKYNLLGGGHIKASTDLGLVEALRRDAQEWLPSVSIEDFMEGMAQRCQVQNGALVRTDGIANFIEDLKAGGFLMPA